MTSRFVPAHLLLIGAFALAAMTTAHGLTLVGSVTLYRHVALVPIAEMAAALLGIGLVAAIRRMAARDRSARDPDWALPAFDAIRRLGFARTAGLVITIQLLSLAAGETIEQRAAGAALTGSIALFGTTLAAAPFIHLAIGLAASALLWTGSREICRHAVDVIQLLRAVVEWISAPTPAPARTAESASAHRAPAAHLRPIAFYLANRPPPNSVFIA